jgi:adenosylmethionine-8-amino-7-oxononanoate aminotransferase
VVREVRGRAFCWEWSSPIRTGKALKRTALQNGIILRIDPSWFAVSPPLIAEESDIDEMYELIERSVTDAIKLAHPAAEQTSR